MIINLLEIKHFGKLKNKTVTFGKGVNVITGDNEAGKTTIAHFVKDMLFGMDEEAPDYGRFYPREFEGMFGGAMEVAENGESYRIERSFLKNSGYLRMTRLSDNSAVEDPEAKLAELLNDITEQEYLAGFFISQNSFLRDMEKYGGNQNETEAVILQQFLTARKVLLESKKMLESKLGGDVTEETENLRIISLENTEKLNALDEQLLQTENAFKAAKEAHDAEVRKLRAEEENEVESARQEMIQKKHALEDAEVVDEARLEKKNVVGTITFIIAILAGVASWFIWNATPGVWMDFNDGNFLLFAGIACGAVLFFLLGLIISIVFSVKKSRSVKLFEERKRIQAEAGEAEANYQKAYNRYEQRKNVNTESEEQKRLARTITELRQQRGKLAADADEIKQKNDALIANADEQEKIRKDLAAVDMALAAYNQAVNGNIVDDAEGLAEEASRILNRISGYARVVRIADDQSVTVIVDGDEMPFTALSTAAGQQVLLALRLANTNRLDGEKKLPMIMDDVFSNFDVDNVNIAMDAIREEGRQVILLSCQERERQSI